MSPRRPRRRLLYAGSGAFAALLLIAAGCRQIVGIGDVSQGDAGDAAAACGLQLTEGDCRSCVEAQCCEAAEACNAVPLCKALEECYAPCSGDPACITACERQFPVGPLAEQNGMEACVATHCGVSCSMSCGMRRGDPAVDSAVACSGCIASQGCPESTACGDSVACRTILTCNSACPTLDCALACQALDDAGAAAYLAFGRRLQGCASECQLGTDWRCVGHVTWPDPLAEANTVTFDVVDPLSGGPIAGASVLLCSKIDPFCAQGGLSHAISDASGKVVLSYTNDLDIGGFDGYAQITGSGLVPTLFYWNFPLTQPAASLEVVDVLTQSELATSLGVLGLTPVAGHGHLGIAAFDCNHSHADAVTIGLTPTDSSTVILYGVGGALSTDAGKTDTTGIAFVANVPAGPVTLDVTSATTGALVSHVSFYVRDGDVDQVYAIPTPQ